MKLTRLEISNVIGIARADIDLKTPITLISGANMTGKTSIRDAISMALLGTPSRVDKKKDLGELLHDGAKKGRVTLVTTEAAANFTLPKGEHESLGEIAGSQFLPLVIDPSKFMALPLDERKRVLFEITGAKPSMKVIQPLLDKAGINKERFEEVSALLRNGFPAVATEAANRARDAKGAWRGVTTKTWGSDAGANWTLEIPEGPEVTQVEIDKAKAAYEKTTTDIDNGNRFIGGLNQQLAANEGRDEKIAALQEAASQLERRETKLTATRADLLKWNGTVDKLTDQLAEAKASANVCECPECATPLKMEAGVLVKATSAKKTASAADITAELNKAREARDLLRRTENKDFEAVTEAKQAATELADVAPVEAVDADKLENARKAITELGLQRDREKAAFEALTERKEMIEGAADTNAKAAAHHAEVLEWLDIADAMGPDGIPAKLLSRAIDPFNQSLEMLANLAGWPAVVVQPDIEVTSNGRRYQLASESEKWRADTLIGLAIAQMTTLRFVVLDRFDVLQNSARQELLRLLIELTNLDLIDSVIMCGTMKEMPKALPEQITGVWVDNAIAEAV